MEEATQAAEVETVECEACGRDFPATEAEERGGSTLCRACAQNYDDTHTECESCNDTVLREDTEERDERTLCSDCVSDYDRHHSTCERCENTVENDDIRRVYVNNRGDEETWCVDCRDNNTWSCSDCEETYSDNVSSYDVHGADGGICRTCLSNNYTRCDGCAEYYPDGDLSGGCCESCGDDETPRGVIDGVLIHEYHDSKHRPAWIFYGDPKEIHYGVELEVNTRDHTAKTTLELLGGIHKEHAFLERDSTLHSGGYEIITHPHTLAEHRKLWKEFLKNPPPETTSFRTGECGMHVHIERKRLSRLQIQKMLVFINAPENETFITGIAQRESGTWCQREPKKLTHTSEDHHDALYLGNNTTVEMRIFRGTMRPDRFWKNLEFVDAVVQWTRDISYRDLTYQNFVSYVRQLRGKYKYLFAYLVEIGYARVPLAQIVKETLQQCA